MEEEFKEVKHITKKLQATKKAKQNKKQEQSSLHYKTYNINKI
jgi:hypothetical protein